MWVTSHLTCNPPRLTIPTIMTRHTGHVMFQFSRVFLTNYICSMLYFDMLLPSITCIYIFQISEAIGKIFQLVSLNCQKSISCTSAYSPVHVFCVPVALNHCCDERWIRHVSTILHQHYDGWKAAQPCQQSRKVSQPPPIKIDGTMSFKLLEISHLSSWCKNYHWRCSTWPLQSLCHALIPNWTPMVSLSGSSYLNLLIFFDLDNTPWVLKAGKTVKAHFHQLLMFTNLNNFHWSINLRCIWLSTNLSQKLPSSLCPFHTPTNVLQQWSSRR